MTAGDDTTQVPQFSVGDRVLVPGVVKRAGDPQNICVEVPRSVGLWFDESDLRPDTGGRDLTASDVEDAYGEAWNRDPGNAEIVAEHLNRIARGDAEPARDDTSAATEIRRLADELYERYTPDTPQVASIRSDMYFRADDLARAEALARRSLADRIRAAGVEGEHPSRGPLISVAAVLTLLDGEDR